MSFASRLNFPSASVFHKRSRTFSLLVLLLSSFLAAAGQTQNLVVKPYSVLGSQTSLGTANTANVAVDSKDNVYYPNFYNNSIYKIDTQGNQTLVPTTGLNSPQGMRFDAADNLYICDASNSRIVVLTPAGVQTVLPVTGLQQPQHLAFDAGYRNLYVSDRYAGILSYNLASQTTSVYATNLFRPEGIAVDAQNNVYYGDGGTLLKNRAPFSTSAGQPNALLFDPAGNLYVEASNGDGLHRIDPTGTILAMADDGSNDIAIDSHGVLYMPSHNGQHMFAYLPGPAIWGGRNDAYVGGRIYYDYANTIRTYYSTPSGVTLTSLTIPAAGSPYSGDNAPSCFTSTLCGADMSLGAFLPGPQPGYALANFSDGTKTTTPLYGSGLQVEMGFSPGKTSQSKPGIASFGGMTNDRNGNVYVSDKTANKIFKFSGTTVTPLAFTGLIEPTQLAVDGTGSVYVLDNLGQRLVKLDSAGNQTVLFTRPGEGPQDFIVSCFAVDGATNIYLGGQTGTLANVIKILRTDGTTSIYASQTASELAFDTFGTLYVGDIQGNLGKFDHFANYIPIATGLREIEAMAIEPSGTVYVSGNQIPKLRQISPTGAVTTYEIAGVNQASAFTIDNYGNLTVGDNSTQLMTFNDRTTQTYAFGDVPVKTSSTQHFSLVNVGSTSGLTISSITGGGPFTVDSGTTTCIPATTNLVAGGTCEVGFTFTPTDFLSYTNTGQVVIPLPTPFYSATVANLALTGTGSKPGPVANAGGPYTGTAGSAVSFNGSASTDPSNEALTYAWSFGDNTSGTGATPNHTYAAGGTYTVALTVTNTDGVTASATTSVTIAQSYTARLTPSSYSFGNVGVGASATTAFTLTNTGTGDLQAGTIQLAVEATNSYSATNTCGTGTLAAGASCTITVTFQPTASGAIATTLTINNAAGSQTAAITGTGVAPTAMLTPVTYDFGGVAVGLSQTTVFTLSNTGAGAIAVGTIVLAPESTSSYSYTKTCGTTLAAGAACTFTVTFKPTTAGSSTTTLNVTDDAGTQKSTITGSGIAPTATLTPTTYDFGTVPIGQSASKDFSLMNTSTVPIAITAITPPVSMGYTRTTNCTSPLAAGASCTITVTFTPYANVAPGDSISVKDDAGTQVATFTGKTVKPTASLTPSMYDFGSLTVGGFAQATFTLTNTGASSLSFGDAELAGDATKSYSVTSNCPATLASGGSCSILAAFQPSTTGTLNSMLYVNDGAGQQTANLTGAGTALSLVLSPSDYNFGSVPVGNTPTKTFTITNNNQISVTFGASLAAEPTHSFSLSSTCGNSIFSGQSCLLTVTFAPTAAVSSNTTLTLTGSAGTHTATLEGSGVSAPQVMLSTTLLSFPPTALGSSTSLALTMSNPGGSALTMVSLFQYGSDFTITGSTCPASLAAGASCTFTIAFIPDSLGKLTGQLSIITGVANPVVFFTGTGVPPLTFDRGVYDFGTVNVGSKSGATFTVTNISAASQDTGTISVVDNGGASVPAYSTATTCPATLASGASCTITVVFTPVASVSYPASLRMVTSTGTLTAALTGTGFLLASDFTLTSNSPQHLYNSGMSFYVQSATPNGTFPYPITFSFNGVGPKGDTAYFTPATVTPGSGVGTSVLTFTDTGHAMLLRGPSPWSRLPFPAACTLFCLGFLARRRLRRGHHGLLLCLTLLIGTLGLIGCGDATGGTVYATGNGITHQYNISFLSSSQEP